MATQIPTQIPIHVLQPGQELSTRFRTATSVVLDNLRTMRLTPSNGGNPYAHVYVTFADARGISVYITRGHNHGGDMQAFLPRDAVSWQSYFEPLAAFNRAYRRTAHFERRFPLDFI